VISPSKPPEDEVPAVVVLVVVLPVEVEPVAVEAIASMCSLEKSFCNSSDALLFADWVEKAAWLVPVRPERMLPMLMAIFLSPRAKDFVEVVVISSPLPFREGNAS
jgi:hypothetical protein